MSNSSAETSSAKTQRVLDPQALREKCKSYLKETIIFFKEGLREFRATGTFFPTWHWAATELIQPLRERKNQQKLRIIEVGPGTGSVTIHILKNLGSEDELVICEINNRFLEALKKSLATNNEFIRAKDRIRFYNCAIQDLPESESGFDVIICAIPFLNLDLETIREIFYKFKQLSHKSTSLTYYEYMALRPLGKRVALSSRRKRLRQIDGFVKQMFKDHLVNRANVYCNILPTHVYRLQKINELNLL